MRTKAAYSLQAGRLEIGEVELAPPQPTEVLIRMRAAGVCHSDLHTYKGELRATPPLVIGHEGAGVVESVGIRVRSVEPGDRVLVNWLPACERCPTCLSGRHNLCERLPEHHLQGHDAGWDVPPADAGWNHAQAHVVSGHHVRVCGHRRGQRHTLSR